MQIPGGCSMVVMSSSCWYCCFHLRVGPGQSCNLLSPPNSPYFFIHLVIFYLHPKGLQLTVLLCYCISSQEKYVVWYLVSYSLNFFDHSKVTQRWLAPSCSGDGFHPPDEQDYMGDVWRPSKPPSGQQVQCPPLLNLWLWEELEIGDAERGCWMAMQAY